MIGFRLHSERLVSLLFGLEGRPHGCMECTASELVRHLKSGGLIPGLAGLCELPAMKPSPVPGGSSGFVLPWL